MKISNLNITKNMKLRTTALVLAGTLSMTALTGCGNSDVATNVITNDNEDYTSSVSIYAVIVIEDNATILEVKDYSIGSKEPPMGSGIERYVMTTTDGSVIYSPFVNTFFFENENTNISVEEFAQSLVGSNGTVNYYGQDKVKSK